MWCQSSTQGTLYSDQDLNSGMSDGVITLSENETDRDNEDDTVIIGFIVICRNVDGTC